VKGPFDPGDAVVLNLGSPREQVFGVLLWIGAAGVLVRCLPVDSLDDWSRQVARGLQGEESTPGGGQIGLSRVFFPMHRVQKVVSDESHGDLEALAVRFAGRVGLPLLEHLRAAHPEDLAGTVVPQAGL
jgi:hypothetical protein